MLGPKHTDKLNEIFQAQFNMSNLELRDDLTAKDGPGWDSFNHVNLIINIEQEFGIRFTIEEVSNLQNLGELKTLLSEKIS